MKFHQYDFRWVDEKYFEIQASLEQRFARKKMTFGDPLSLEVCSDVSCAGSILNDVWAPCPNTVKGKAKCETCKAREQKGNFVFTVFDGFNQENLTPEELEKISGPHVVYLALFDENLIKVGVSKAERKTLRQLEQGAYATLFIAQTPNGTLARQIESTLRKNGVQDKVLGSQKKDIFDPNISAHESEKMLRRLFELHQKSISESPNLRSFLLETPEFHLWESFYHLPEIRKNKKHIHPVQLKKDEWVSGTIVATRGSFLVLETPQELLSLGLKNLNGFEVEFDKKSPGISLKSAMQSVLF